MGKLLLLLPLVILVVASRPLQLWRGIFYTCPSRTCAYRGLPLYVCPHCGEGNPNLWPNLYGVFWHYCLKCDARLPALDLLGRSRLARQCGGCGIPLLGKHAGRAPERLVAIVGGPDSGKTSYLLMAVHALLHGTGQAAMPLRGEVDDVTQETEFQREWQQLASGLPIAKTAAVAKAFLLYVTVGRAKCQLYLYDAPGEEFTSISTMTQQQYLPLLEGCILLVDPLRFASTSTLTAGSNGAAAALQEVVAATVAATASGMAAGQGGKLPLRVAVVISKADLGFVKDTIGDIRQNSIPGETCRAAIVRWGGDNALRALEQRFASVAYFSCSPLGRAVEAGNRQPFQGSGVLEPLLWLLTGYSHESRV